jgi:hypothetical protein
MMRASNVKLALITRPRSSLSSPCTGRSFLLTKPPIWTDSHRATRENAKTTSGKFSSLIKFALNTHFPGRFVPLIGRGCSHQPLGRSPKAVAVICSKLNESPTTFLVAKLVSSTRLCDPMTSPNVTRLSANGSSPAVRNRSLRR